MTSSLSSRGGGTSDRLFPVATKATCMQERPSVSFVADILLTSVLLTHVCHNFGVLATGYKGHLQAGR